MICGSPSRTFLPLIAKQIIVVLPKFILVHASAGTELSRNNSGTIQFRIEQRMTVQQPMRQESL